MAEICLIRKQRDTLGSSTTRLVADEFISLSCLGLRLKFKRVFMMAILLWSTNQESAYSWFAGPTFALNYPRADSQCADQRLINHASET